MITRRPTLRLEVDVMHPERGAWAVGLSIEVDSHPSETTITITAGAWRLVILAQR